MIIILILLLILLYLLLIYKETFIVNPNHFFTGITPMTTLRDLRECKLKENQVSCILDKRPLSIPKSSFYPRFTRVVNYQRSQNVRHLMPIQRPIRITPNV